MIQTCSMSMMISKGHSPAQMLMMANDDMMSMYSTLIIKLTAGLSAMEELH